MTAEPSVPERAVSDADVASLAAWAGASFTCNPKPTLACSSGHCL
jgi:hypothetical protein